MNRVLTFLTIVLLFCSCHTEEIHPNILIINVDDMGWRDLNFMTSEFYESPFIDELASQGMIFMQGYASAANCAPSRACMMSGQWTPRHQIYTVNNSDRGGSRHRKIIPVPNNMILPDSILTLADILQQHGYYTIHAGKWHLSKDPLDYGFDVNIGGGANGHPRSYYPPFGNVDLEAPNDEYLTDLIMIKTIDQLKEKGNKPFFLNYSPYAVHTPIHKVDSLMYKFEYKQPWRGQTNKEYATMIYNLDRNIGDLIKFLKKEDLYNNTFIIFTSDNGGPFHITRQPPLRAGKGSYFEGGIRVPMFFVWEDRIKRGTDFETPVTNLDFYPTILDVTGIKKPDNKILDGNSLTGLLTGKEALEKRSLFWHFPIYLQNGNSETHDTLFRTRPGSVIRHGKWKLHQYFEEMRLELYDLENDVMENVNLADENPEKAGELLDLLEEWREQVNAPIPQTLNPEYEEMY